MVEKTEIEERGKDKPVASRAKEKAGRVRAEGRRRFTASEGPGQHRKQRSAILGFILHSEILPIKPKVTILVLDSPEPSEATDGSDYESTPSCPALGVTGARGGFPVASTTRALRKRTLQKAVYSVYPTNESNLRIVDE